MSVSIATWNINSVRLRKELVVEFLQTHPVDILCLQEIKCTEDQFPSSAFSKIGYSHIGIHGQKAYHGVATISRHPLKLIEKRDFCNQGDARHLSTSCEIDGHQFLVHNFYVPAGGDEPDRQSNPKFAHKLDFIEEMKQMTAGQGPKNSSILVGDLNIAPHENDVWSHKQLLKIVSHTPVETEGLNAVRDQGKWIDLVRTGIPQTEKIYTWWSYRARDWAASNRGRRLDHIWGSENLADKLAAIDVITQARGWEKPSDHVPLIARFDGF